MDKMVLEQAYSNFFGFTLFIIIPPLFHTHKSPLTEVYDSSDKTAQYHILGVQV
jgi:hypothetical protein